MLNISKSPKNSPYKFNSTSFVGGKSVTPKDLSNKDLSQSVNKGGIAKMESDAYAEVSPQPIHLIDTNESSTSSMSSQQEFSTLSSPAHHVSVDLGELVRSSGSNAMNARKNEKNEKNEAREKSLPTRSARALKVGSTSKRNSLKRTQKVNNRFSREKSNQTQKQSNLNINLKKSNTKSKQPTENFISSNMEARDELIHDLREDLEASHLSTHSGDHDTSPQKRTKEDEIVYPTLKQPILLDDVEYMTRLRYSSNQWQLCVKSPHFENIEYQVYVTPAHHSRITMNHPIQPRGLFELVKGALFDGAASFDYFWIRGTEYMTLGNVNEVLASQNGWKGDARLESDRLLLWVGLGRDLGYWLILEPVRVEISSKHLLKQLKVLEEEHSSVLMQNKSLLIRNDVLLRQQDTLRSECNRQREDIIDLKKENAKLKQMLVNMIQHMVQKQQKMMEALGDLEALHEDSNTSSIENMITKIQNRSEPGFVWNPLKKHQDLSLSNFCKTVLSNESPSGNWASVLGDNVWTEGVHQWDIMLRGESDPQYQSVIIGVSDPDHNLATFCGSTSTSYGLFIHSGNVYHNQLPKAYIRTTREATDNDENIPFIRIKPLDCITVILDLDNGTLKYDVNHCGTLNIAFENVKGPLCPCISFCDSTHIELV